MIVEKFSAVCSFALVARSLLLTSRDRFSTAQSLTFAPRLSISILEARLQPQKRSKARWLAVEWKQEPQSVLQDRLQLLSTFFLSSGELPEPMVTKLKAVGVW